MADEITPGCTRPGATVDDVAAPEAAPAVETQPRKETRSMIQVGRKAPDFSVSGYQNGTFIQAKLSDYLGKWVLLCFYPGDFTFV